MSLIKRSNCISIGRFKTLIFLNNEYIALFACSAICFLQLKWEPVFDK